MTLSMFKSVFGDALNSKKASLVLKIEEIKDDYEKVEAIKADIEKAELLLRDVQTKADFDYSQHYTSIYIGKDVVKGQASWKDRRSTLIDIHVYLYWCNHKNDNGIYLCSSKDKKPVNFSDNHTMTRLLKCNGYILIYSTQFLPDLIKKVIEHAHEHTSLSMESYAIKEANMFRKEMATKKEMNKPKTI